MSIGTRHRLNLLNDNNQRAIELVFDNIPDLMTAIWLHMKKTSKASCFSFAVDWDDISKEEYLDLLNLRALYSTCYPIPNSWYSELCLELDDFKNAEAIGDYLDLCCFADVWENKYGFSPSMSNEKLLMWGRNLSEKKDVSLSPLNT